MSYPDPYKPPSPFADAPYPQAPYQQPQAGDSTGGVIPYKNPYALIAYYLGIFGLLCCFTPLPLGIVPVILGFIGLRKHAQNPVIHGVAHAWVGIICGAISTFCSIMVALVIILASQAK